MTMQVISTYRNLFECSIVEYVASSFYDVFISERMWDTNYPRDAMLARVFARATCLSVRLSVCHTPVLSQNEDDFFTTW